MYMILIKMLIFFYNISVLISNSQENHVIICGDFNLAVHPSIHVNNYKAINNWELLELLVNIMNDIRKQGYIHATENIQYNKHD